MDTPVHSAVILAMERELLPFLRRCRRVDVETIRCYEHQGTVYACGGIGRSAAARATSAILERCRPRRVISAGFAGALDTRLKVGQVLKPEVVIDTQTKQQYRTTPVESPAEHITLVTADATAGAGDKKQIASRFGAQLLDMEAGAVAEVAARAGVEFMAVKAVSDELDFAMPPVGRFVSRDGQFQQARFIAWTAWHPAQWAPVWQLGRNSHAAARALSAYFERFGPRSVECEVREVVR